MSAAAARIVPDPRPGALPELGDPVGIARQIVAVLEEERRALAGLDRDGILACATAKAQLCDTLDAHAPSTISAELRDLLLTARRLNDANGRLRNLVAGKISTRLTALSGRPGLYRVQGRSPGWRR